MALFERPWEKVNNNEPAQAPEVKEQPVLPDEEETIPAKPEVDSELELYEFAEGEGDLPPVPVRKKI